MKTENFIYKILNLEKGEGLMVLLPLIYSFFAGASLAFFVTGSTALFLNIFKLDMLSIAFIASGIIVWIIGQAFSGIQKRIQFTKSITAGVAFLLISIVVFVLFLLGARQLVIIFILYTWIRVFAFIHAVTFWGMAGRLFTLRQGKRVFGLISGGEVIASIIAFFSVPFLLKLISTEDLLLISAICLFIGFIFMLGIVKKFSPQLSSTAKKLKPIIENEKRKNTSFLQNRYYKLFFVIAFIPIFAQFFIDFIFQAQAKLEFPDKEELTAFVGIFFGISSIVEFFLKSFISGRLMAKYGMKFGLLAFPVMLLFSVILSTLFGVIYGAFSLFFSFVALGRLFTRAVRTSFNDPATQILYQPIPPDERISFQNKVESGPKAYASIAAGILLLLFAKIPGFSLVYFSAFLLLVIIFWSKSAIEIYKEYRQELQMILSTKKENLDSDNFQPLLRTLIEKIKSGNPEDLNSLIKLCRLIYPFETDKIVSQNPEIINKPEASKALKFNDMIELSKSENPNDQILAARNLSNYSIYKVEKVIVRLLHDENFEVKSEAIITSGRMKESDLSYHIVTLFQNPAYNQIVSAAMINIGESIITELDHEFQKSEYNISLQLKIIETAEKIGGLKVIDFLKKNIRHPNYIVSEQIIKTLGALNYRSNKYESTLIWQKVEDKIKNYVYLASTIVNLKKYAQAKEIITSLEREKREKKQIIFSLLSVMYDQIAIKLIADNLESNDKDAKGFAMEIADIIISDIHKPLLLPLFDFENEDEIISQYHHYFPSEKFSLVDQLIDILNTEYWVTSLYIKTSAIEILSSIDEKRILPILITNIVHPQPMMREFASFCLYKKDKILFEKEINKNFTKSPGLKDFAKEISLYENGFKELIYRKLKRIKEFEIFNTIVVEQLIELATKSIEITLQNENEQFITESLNEFILILEGELCEIHTRKIIGPDKILCPYLKPNEYNKVYKSAKGKTVILKVKIHHITTLLVKNLTFTKKLINTLWTLNISKKGPEDSVLADMINEINH